MTLRASPTILLSPLMITRLRQTELLTNFLDSLLMSTKKMRQLCLRGKLLMRLTSAISSLTH